LPSLLPWAVGIPATCSITLHRLFGFKFDTWTDLLRLADTIAVVSITFAYSFLLHVHLHLWANAQNGQLTRKRKSSGASVLLSNRVSGCGDPQNLECAYAPMFTKLSGFVLPFAFWIAYVLGLIAVTELLIARRSKNRSEKESCGRSLPRSLGLAWSSWPRWLSAWAKAPCLACTFKTVANLGSLLAFGSARLLHLPVPLS